MRPSAIFFVFAVLFTMCFSAMAVELELSEEEKAWLENHPGIRVGPAPNFPPVEFFDDQGLFHGIAADYMKLIEDRLGITFEVRREKNWGEVVEKTRQRDIDLWLEAAQTPERDEFMLFSEPYLVLPAVIIVRQEETGNLDLSNLKGMRVAAIDGYATVDYLRKNAPELELLLVPSIEEGLSRVAFGSADAIIVSSAPASHYIEQLGLTNLRVAGQSGFVWELSIASRRDWPMLNSLLEKALASISEDERRLIFRRWVSLDQPSSSGSLSTIVVIASAGFVALAVLVLIFLRRTTGGSRPGRSRSRSVWPVYLAAVLVIAAILLLTWKTEALIREQAREDVARALKGVLNSTSTSTHAWLQAKESEVRSWCHHPEVEVACRKLLNMAASGDVENIDDVITELREQLAQLMESGDYSGYALLTPDGRVVGGFNDDIAAVGLKAPPGMITSLLNGQRNSIVRIPIKEDAGANNGSSYGGHILVAASVRNGAAVPMGVLALMIDPGANFSRIVQRGRMGSSGESYAFNRYAQAVSRSRFEQALQQLNLVDEGQSSVLNLEIRDPGGNLLKGYRSTLPRHEHSLTKMAHSATRGQSDINLEGYNDYRGVPVIGAWVWDDEIGLGITTEIDVAEAYRSLNTNRRLFRTFVAMTIALILALTLLFRIFSARQSAIAARMRLQSEALKAVGNGIVITNTDGTIEWVNPAFSELTGYSFSEVVGQNPRALKSDDHPEEFYANMWRTITSGNVWTGEVINRRKDGLTYTEEMTITPVKDDSNKISHYVAIKKDISERKEMENQLRRTQEKAEEANRAKSAFMANMSHELRTPMNAIIGYSEMLAEDAEDEGHDDMIPDLEKITNAGKHLLALINDVLDLSKIEAGRMDLFLEQFDVHQMVEETVSTIKPLISQNRNQIVMDIEDEIGTMYADLTKVRQALFNLLSNATKFTSDGIITLTAARYKQGEYEWIRFDVKDTGIGIPADKVDHVFKEFSQADDSTTREYGGTGLGLPISRRFCQMMGGEITLKSEVGHGSTFTIELPAETKPIETPTEDMKCV